MPSRALATRINRLERARQSAERSPPSVFVRISPERAPEGAVVGVRTWQGPEIPRRAGEPLRALLARAMAEGGMAGRTLFAIYSPEYLSERKAARPPKPIASPEPSVGIAPKPDPFALAGIGRTATAEELARMGIRAAFRQPD